MSENKVSGHPHAELMAQFAEDAKTHMSPWQLWEIQPGGGGSWKPCTHIPNWTSDCQYRRKKIPREFWANVYSSNGRFAYNYLHNNEASAATNLALGGETIHLVEVLPENK